MGTDDLSASRLNEFAQIVQVLSAGVADHEVAKAVGVPGPDFKRQGGWHGLILACLSRSPILENEDRNLVLAEAKNEFCTRRLAEIADLSAYQDERRPLQFGQVEGEGNLARKPWFHGVPVGGNNVNRVQAGKGCHMLIHQFADERLLAPVESQKKRTGKQHHGGCCQNGKPSKTPKKRPSPRDAILHARPKGGVRHKPLAGGLNRTFQLNFAQAFCGAGGASAQMFSQGARLAGGELSVEIGIEFFSPRLAGHESSDPYSVPCNCCTASRRARRARDNRDITVPIGMARVRAIS